MNTSLISASVVALSMFASSAALANRAVQPPQSALATLHREAQTRSAPVLDARSPKRVTVVDGDNGPGVAKPFSVSAVHRLFFVGPKVKATAEGAYIFQHVDSRGQITAASFTPELKDGSVQRAFVSKLLSRFNSGLNAARRP
jgi:hypothetical protein